MVVLATKMYGDDTESALASLQSLIENDLGQLEVTWDIGVRRDNFPSVTIEGPDETVARNLLIEQWGQITDTFEAGTTYSGTLQSWDEEGFHLDAGESVTIPPAELGLGVGTPEQIATRFGLVKHLPMQFVYGDVHELAEETRDLLYGWQRGPSRITANGMTRSQLRATINRAGHAQDIVTIERIGLLEQSVICEDDTDAPGLLASIGPYVPGQLAVVQ